MISLYRYGWAGLFWIAASAWAAPEGNKTNSATQPEEGRYRSALLFANVVELIRDEYLDIEKTDYDKMTYAALRGLLSSLDPHSQFLDPENYKLIRTETEGQFGGLGISIGLVENQLTINVPIEGGPAYRAGLLPGDRIVKIDGAGTQKLTLGEAIRKLRGRPGGVVKLTVYRPGETKTMEVSVVREMIQVPTITDVGVLSESTTRGEKIGYLRITQFGEKTDHEFDAALAKLEAQGAVALILDLRDNPGGLVKLPTVVLVNGNTASAAEIVAGALQDLGKAVIVGETTFGKGSVQTVQRVDPSVTPDVGVRLTTAHYTTPSRKKIHGVGIEPDITARLTRTEEQGIYRQRSPGLQKTGDPVAEIKDEPLDRAVDILRGWKVVARRTQPIR